MSITVLRTGPLVLVQDGGRPGWAHLGVPPAGALDLDALALANRLVGNDDRTAGLEVLLGGLSFVPSKSLRIAVTGAVAPVTVAARVVGWGSPISVAAEDEVVIGEASSGLRVYIAVGGGIDVPAVLGSRSTDTFTALGPPRVRAGDRLPVGTDTIRDPVIDEVPPRPYDEDVTVRVDPGPRADWFEHAARSLRSGEFVVSSNSDRVAVRLDGPALRRRRGSPEELASEGLVTGAVQVPSDGRPLVFMNDHPVTGGYPVIGVVRRADLGRLAQARPGEHVRLRPTWLDPSEHRRRRRGPAGRVEG
jgi:biotin-dependent carboxylase-like uncharacterized protein